MFKNFIKIYAILFLALSACLPQGDKHFLNVDYVIDGDTFQSSGKRVRIWGIDAPEENQPFYQTSRLYLESLIFDETLECNYLDTGRYARDVMRCYLGNKDISAEMISAGMARDYPSFSNGYYERDEAYAKKQKRGIWKE